MYLHSGQECTNTSPQQQQSLVRVLPAGSPWPAAAFATPAGCTALPLPQEQGQKEPALLRILPETHFCYLISKSFQELEIHPTLAKRRIKMCLKCQHLGLGEFPSWAAVPKLALQKALARGTLSSLVLQDGSCSLHRAVALQSPSQHNHSIIL